MAYQNLPIEVLAGTQPDTDFTQQSTPHYVFSQNIRYVDGFPEKIGGNTSITTTGASLMGCPRNIFSYISNNNVSYVLGTHSSLYNLFGNELTNITPVDTSVSNYNNILATFFGTLANNPIDTVLGSNVITINDTAHILIEGDVVSLSGSAAVGGVPAIDINKSHFIGNVTVNSYDVTVSTTATSTASGGGAAVVRATNIITVTDSTTVLDGDNIEISNLGASVGGIPTGDIEGVRAIRNLTGTTYDIVADSAATSSVSGAGGNIDIAYQIAAGTCDPTTGTGYGLGLYGEGLYGVPKSATNPTFPSIWSFDRFGNLIILTRGTQTGLYSWTANVEQVPILVANAPTAINYCFTSNEIAVTLGASGVENRIQWSDQGGLTTWTGTAENKAGQDDIEGASEFISHASLRGFNLLFTREQVYSFRFIDKPFVWETKQIDPARGLIAQNARVVVNGICYWMGRDNFFQYRGGNVEVIPSNSTTQSTVKKHVFNNINTAQDSKCFTWYNEEFNEIWFHYPSESSDEPDSVATYNVMTRVWGIHSYDRTAAEYPSVLKTFPLLADITDVIYEHERGTDDDGSPLSWTLSTPFFNSGTNNILIGGVIFDSIRSGDITVKVLTKTYPKDTPVETEYTVPDTIDKISFRRRARYWQYEISGSELGQFWRAGIWMQEIKGSGRI